MAFRIRTISYDANDRISRILVADGFDSVAHDITYNLSNEMISIKVDSSSMVGHNAFEWSFENMVWQNGNVESLDVVGDINFQGLLDTIEFVLTYDSMPNLGRLLPIEETSSLIEQISTNNFKSMVSVKGGVIGPAGTIALERVYTYYISGEVSSKLEKWTSFNHFELATGYRFSCSGIGLKESALATMSVYPNPTKDRVKIRAYEDIQSIGVWSLNGQLLLGEVGSGSSHVLSLKECICFTSC